MSGVKSIYLLIFLMLLSTSDTLARQYKSRVFTDSSQELSSAKLQSIAALEQAFTGFQDSYQIATTGKLLARQMVAEQKYEKAVEYYYKALQSGTGSAALAEPVLKQLRRELTSVLLKLQRYREVVTLFEHQPGNSEDLFLAARGQLGLQQFHQVVKILQPLTGDLQDLTWQQLQQLAGLLYQADALQLTAKVLTELLRRTPEDLNTARQLTGIYIRLKAFQQALDLWSLKHAQGLLLRLSQTAAQDILLLTDLYQRQQAPDKAARLLEQAISDGTVPATQQNTYRLFEFWYQAKEIRLARTALWQSIQTSQGSEKSLQHSLILAELLQQAQHWQALRELILFSCDSILPDQYAGRINLFYGIALHKLGNNSDARRAFINASLVSGVKSQAREWLAFMGAEPATLDESRRLWGPCLPDDPEIALPKDISITAKKNTISPVSGTQLRTTEHPNATTEALTVAQLDMTRLYSTRITTTAADLPRDVKAKTFTLLKNLMRSGGKIAGKMHLLFSFDELSQSGDSDVAAPLKLSVAFPYSGVPRTKAGFKTIRLPARNALVSRYKGPAIALAEQWQTLITQALQQGLTPSGEAVMVFVADTTGSDKLNVELQLTLE